MITSDDVYELIKVLMEKEYPWVVYTLDVTAIDLKLVDVRLRYGDISIYEHQTTINCGIPIEFLTYDIKYRLNRELELEKKVKLEEFIKE